MVLWNSDWCDRPAQSVSLASLAHTTRGWVYRVGMRGPGVTRAGQAVARGSLGGCGSAHGWRETGDRSAPSITGRCRRRRAPLVNPSGGHQRQLADVGASLAAGRPSCVGLGAAV